MKSNLQIEITGHVLIKDYITNEILLDKKNAVHGQNMARAISRLLSREPNGYIYLLKFGNGGTFIDAVNNIIIKKPNDGNNGDGWESQLYNQTFAKVVDEDDIQFGFNPTGGGAEPSPSDLANSGVFSQEVGLKSNVVITVILNENEPSSQLPTSMISAPTGEERQFIFDEIGLFTSGKPAQATNGISNVNVGNKISTDEFPIQPNHVSTLPIIVDGISYTAQISTPASGTGPNGIITYGDFCEGLNSGAWITGGDALNGLLHAFITDRSANQYPSIIAKESFGLLAFESKTTGSDSSISLVCDVNSATNFFNILTSGVCGNVNVNTNNGQDAGVQNDPINPINERERLLTHLIFSPILKANDRSILATYTLTITVKQSQDSIISQEFTT